MIRREYPEAAAFEAFVAEHTPVPPAEARLMADTWTAVRKNRNLRELAQHKPDEALTFVNGFIEAGLATQLETLDETDREFAAAMALPPRQRRAALRELVEAKHAVDAGHHPADREYIKALTVERDAAVEALEEATKAERLDERPARRLALRREKLGALIQHFYDFVAEHNAELAAMDFTAVPDAESVPYEEALGHGRNEVLSLFDALDARWRAYVHEA